MLKMNNNEKKFNRVITFVFILFTLISIFASFIGFLKTLILVIIVLFLIFPLALYLSNNPEGKIVLSIKKIPRKIWDFLNKSKEEKIHDFLNLVNNLWNDLFITIKKFYIILLAYFLLLFTTISFYGLSIFLMEKYYDNYLNTQIQNDQELYDFFFNEIKEKNILISELGSESETLRLEKALREEIEAEALENEIQIKSIKSLKERGRSYYSENKYSKAKGLFKEALALPEKSREDSENLGYCCYYLGMICMREEKYGASIDYSMEACEFFQEGKSIEMEAWSAYNVGKVKSYYTGECEDGIEWYKKALDIFIEIGYQKKEAIVRYELGLAYEECRDRKKALDELRISRDLYDGLKLYIEKNKVIEEIERIDKKKYRPF